MIDFPLHLAPRPAQRPFGSCARPRTDGWEAGRSLSGLCPKEQYRLARFRGR